MRPGRLLAAGLDLPAQVEMKDRERVRGNTAITTESLGGYLDEGVYVCVCVQCRAEMEPLFTTVVTIHDHLYEERIGADTD